MKDFWKKLDEAFAYIFNNTDKKEEKNANTGDERRLRRSNGGTRK